MSFEEQQRVLFDLLFNEDLRKQFCEDTSTALQFYTLTEEERVDFTSIRPDALEIDANMRRNILLGHLCRAFPVSFAIVSSLSEGKTMLKKLLDSKIMRTPSLERAREFGIRLREHLLDFTFASAHEKTLVIAIVEAELALALTASTLKSEVLQTGKNIAVPAPPAADCMNKPVKLAAFVAAVIIPLSYVELKRSFCAVADTELWTHLAHSPISKSLRTLTLAKENPRLLVVRASITHMSRCEPVVDHQTVELSDGFAQLFQHVNGTISVEQILAHLKQAGATTQILDGVQAGFRQLFEKGMLETV